MTVAMLFFFAIGLFLVFLAWRSGRDPGEGAPPWIYLHLRNKAHRLLALGEKNVDGQPTFASVLDPLTVLFFHKRSRRWLAVDQSGPLGESDPVTEPAATPQWATVSDPPGSFLRAAWKGFRLNVLTHAFDPVFHAVAHETVDGVTCEAVDGALLLPLGRATEDPPFLSGVADRLVIEKVNVGSDITLVLRNTFPFRVTYGNVTQPFTSEVSAALEPGEVRDVAQPFNASDLAASGGAVEFYLQRDEDRAPRPGERKKKTCRDSTCPWRASAARRPNLSPPRSPTPRLRASPKPRSSSGTPSRWTGGRP